MVKECGAIRWGLVSVVLAMGMVAEAQTAAPLNSRQLSSDYMKAHGDKDWALAIEIGRKWTKLKSKDSTAAYNLACAYALNGDKAEALRWVQKAVDNGFRDADLMMSDADLESIRTDPGFVAAHKKVEAAQQRVQVRAKERLDEAAAREPLVILPPGHDATRSASLIVALHGFGSEANDIAGAWREAAAKEGAILMAPNGPRMEMQGGHQWGSVQEAEVMVNAAIDYVQGKYAVDSERIVLTGFSQGGMMAFQIGLRNPAKFRGVIPMAGRYESSSALHMMPASGWPNFYLMVGANDRIVEQNRRAEGELKAVGAKVKLVVYPDLGHEFPPNRTAELQKALAFVWAKR